MLVSRAWKLFALVQNSRGSSQAYSQVLRFGGQHTFLGGNIFVFILSLKQTV